MSIDPYENKDFTRLYDWAYSDLEDDIPLYLELGNIYGSRFLELGCGSGRITFPLAEAGYRVTALDLSDEMLALARERAENLPSEITDLIAFVCDDMSRYDIDGVFDIAFVPYSSIYHLDTAEKKLSCLKKMAASITDKGAAVIDMVNPLIMECQEPGDSFIAKEGINPATGKETVQIYNVAQHDFDNQILEVEHVFIEDESETYRWKQKFWWLNGSQISSLLREAGFREVNVFGDYDLSPYHPEADRLICSALL